MKKLFLISAMLFAMSIASIAQSKCPVEDIQYRRSSLYTMLIESHEFAGKKDMVLKAYHNAPFPDKYNNHSIVDISLDPSTYPITDAEREAAGIKKSAAGKLLSAAESSATGGVISVNAADMPLIISKYIKKEKIANALVAKWFNRQEDGTFDMNLIGERGFYNASDLQANIAKASVKGTSSLADAGEELINNTFFVANRLKFVSNEVVAAVIRDAALSTCSNLSGFAKKIAEKSAEKIYNKTKEGYSVWTTSYLFQLKWNEEIANTFYDELWMDKSSIDTSKKSAFDNSDLFELEYVGTEHSSSLVTFTFKDRTEEDILNLSTVRNLNAVYAKLQKKYDVFKTKTPITSVNPVTARIGLKEGLKGGERFEVLEQVVDKKTGLTKYVKKCIIKVKKKKIWDNRFNAGNEVTTSGIQGTQFKGGKKCYPGMLIRQIK